MENYEEIVKFWMIDTPVKKKYVQDDSFDAEIRSRFGELQTKAAGGALESWEDDAESSLALVILLDQFSRNLFRGSSKSFESDELVLDIARRSIEKGFDLQVKTGRSLFYMPFMHSEELEDQKTCVKLFEKMAADTGEEVNKFAHGHMDIIEEYGRFPGRNKVLGRGSTSEEIEFLEKGGGY